MDTSPSPPPRTTEPDRGGSTGPAAEVAEPTSEPISALPHAGKTVLFTSDGDFTLFIDDLAGVGVHGFVLEPMTDMAAIAERYGKTHLFVGNVDTRVLLRNDREAIRAEVERAVSIGRDCPGFVVAVGNHIPANTPVEAALYYNEVLEELRLR